MRQYFQILLTVGILFSGLFLLTNCHCGKSYALVSHTHTTPQLREKHFTTEDAQTFSYRRFLSKNHTPKTIIIAIHGFCGASIDYENLGKHLITSYPRIGLYAYDVRGQGLDPVRERRGDIDQKQKWFRDLETFTRLVNERHPNASIVWQGESMGALILTSAYRDAIEHNRRPLCDGIIITSPVVGVRDDFPQWKLQFAKKIADVFPDARISLDSLSGGQNVQMTATSTHSEQSETNAWHIETHTLRLLLTLEGMIAKMDENAKFLNVPTLVAHGGNDYFCEQKKVQHFYEKIQHAPSKRRDFYPQAHHLLMYDQERDKVIDNIASWVHALPKKAKTAVPANPAH